MKNLLKITVIVIVILISVQIFLEAHAETRTVACEQF